MEMKIFEGMVEHRRYVYIGGSMYGGGWVIYQVCIETRNGKKLEKIRMVEYQDITNQRLTGTKMRFSLFFLINI